MPLRVSPPLSKYWSRQQVFDYLVEIAENAKGEEPVLVGIDFAFAHPFADKHSYFPETDLSPADVVSLWAMVDQVNDGQPDLYGGASVSACDMGRVLFSAATLSGAALCQPPPGY